MQGSRNLMVGIVLLAVVLSAPLGLAARTQGVGGGGADQIGYGTAKICLNGEADIQLVGSGTSIQCSKEASSCYTCTVNEPGEYEILVDGKHTGKRITAVRIYVNGWLWTGGSIDLGGQHVMQGEDYNVTVYVEGAEPSSVALCEYGKAEITCKKDGEDGTFTCGIKDVETATEFDGDVVIKVANTEIRVPLHFQVSPIEPAKKVVKQFSLECEDGTPLLTVECYNDDCSDYKVRGWWKNREGNVKYAEMENTPGDNYGDVWEIPPLCTTARVKMSKGCKAVIGRTNVENVSQWNIKPRNSGVIRPSNDTNCLPAEGIHFYVPEYYAGLRIDGKYIDSSLSFNCGTLEDVKITVEPLQFGNKHPANDRVDIGDIRNKSGSFHMHMGESKKLWDLVKEGLLRCGQKNKLEVWGSVPVIINPKKPTNRVVIDLNLQGIDAYLKTANGNETTNGTAGDYGDLTLNFGKVKVSGGSLDVVVQPSKYGWNDKITCTGCVAKEKDCSGEVTFTVKVAEDDYGKEKTLTIQQVRDGIAIARAIVKFTPIKGEDVVGSISATPEDINAGDTLTIEADYAVNEKTPYLCYKWDGTWIAFGEPLPKKGDIKETVKTTCSENGIVVWDGQKLEVPCLKDAELEIGICNGYGDLLGENQKVAKVQVHKYGADNSICKREYLLESAYADRNDVWETIEKSDIHYILTDGEKEVPLSASGCDVYENGYSRVCLGKKFKDWNIAIADEISKKYCTVVVNQYTPTIQITAGNIGGKIVAKTPNQYGPFILEIGGTQAGSWDGSETHKYGLSTWGWAKKGYIIEKPADVNVCVGKSKGDCWYEKSVTIEFNEPLVNGANPSVFETGDPQNPTYILNIEKKVGDYHVCGVVNFSQSKNICDVAVHGAGSVQEVDYSDIKDGTEVSASGSGNCFAVEYCKTKKKWLGLSSEDVPVGYVVACYDSGETKVCQNES